MARADQGGISAVELASECDGEPRLGVLAPVDASREACEDGMLVLWLIVVIGQCVAQLASLALVWFEQRIV